MRRLGSYLGEVGCWLAWFFLWCGSGTLIALLVRVLGFDRLQRLSTRLWGVGLIYAFAAAFFLSGSYFLVLILKSHGRRGRLVREGPVGRIGISLWAIEGLVRETLKGEIASGRFRVRLMRTSPQAIRIRVKAELAGQQSVVRVSEEIQRLLKGRVEERTGVEVAEVEVLVGGISVARRAEDIEGGLKQ